MFFMCLYLKKYVYDPKHVIDWDLLQVELEGEFEHEPLCILDKQEKQLRKQTIVQLKIQWRHSGFEEATWEREDDMRHIYTFFFLNSY